MVLEICKWVYIVIALGFVVKTAKEVSQLQKSVYLALTMLACVLAILVHILQKL